MPATGQLEEQIAKVLEANAVCSFGTVDGNQPRIRYMALFHDQLTIYLATNKKADKVDELKQNPNVFVLVGYDGRKSSDILQIQAKAEVVTDNALREKLWNGEFAKWFDGPHDPDYAVLKIAPDRIEYYQGEETQPKVWQR